MELIFGSFFHLLLQRCSGPDKCVARVQAAWTIPPRLKFPKLLLNITFGELKGFDAPDEAGGPVFLSGEAGAPDGENLGTLVDAFEAFFGLGDGFNGSDPELIGSGSVQRETNALPAVFHAQHRAGERAAEAQILRAI
jgi:hypothetical protein